VETGHEKIMVLRPRGAGRGAQSAEGLIKEGEKIRLLITPLSWRDLKVIF